MEGLGGCNGGDGAREHNVGDIRAESFVLAKCKQEGLLPRPRKETTHKRKFVWERFEFSGKKCR